MEASPEIPAAPRLPFLKGLCMQQVRRIVGTIASYASLSILGRVVQMLTAFLVVRSLGKTEYAWYSLANNLVGALVIFTVTGVSTGLMPLAGEVARDRDKLGAVLASASRFRTGLLFFGSLVGLPLFIHLLLRSGCPALSIVLLVGAAVVSLMVSISTQMIATPLSLARRYNIPQWENILSSLLRMLCIVTLVFSGFADAVTVMIVTVLAPLPTVCGWMLPKAREHAAFGQQADPAATQSLKKYFLIGLPANITHLFEAQVALFIVGWLGNIDKVADLGAICRVALILQIPLAIASGIMLPRMATEQNLQRLWRMWTGSTALSVLIGAGIVACGWLLRHQLLFLLGPAYAGLEYELVLYLGLQAFSFFATVATIPIQAKGWVRHSWLRPFAVFGSQALAACVLDLSTVSGAIGLMWAGSVGNLLLDSFLLFNGWRGRAGI
ncbi:lipopolysaccharide biosynthesis protein [Prosthecobacter sp.]|uniref:lipopolysaccharide biosynthesis protein n=1 Tax=Prosthecobacter sp. TaxID=1965333 RepID=UPI00378339C4